MQRSQPKHVSNPVVRNGITEPILFVFRCTTSFCRSSSSTRTSACVRMPPKLKRLCWYVLTMPPARGVMYGVLLWADMNAATSLGAWGRWGALQFPLHPNTEHRTVTLTVPLQETCGGYLRWQRKQQESSAPGVASPLPPPDSEQRYKVLTDIFGASLQPYLQ